MSRRRFLPSPERLHELFEYRAADGRLVRRVSVNATFLAGSVAGSQRRDGYRRVTVDGKGILEHLIVWLLVRGPIADDKIVDHRDLDKSNNRIENLRLATNSLNRANERVLKNNKLGIKGVHFAKKTQKYRAQIKIDGKKIWLGDFSAVADAQSAYSIAAKKLFGEFARVA